MLKVKLPLKKESLLFRKSVFCLLYNTFSDQHFLFEYKTGFQNFIITLAKRIAFLSWQTTLSFFVLLLRLVSNQTTQIELITLCQVKNFSLKQTQFLKPF